MNFFFPNVHTPVYLRRCVTFLYSKGAFIDCYVKSNPEGVWQISHVHFLNAVLARGVADSGLPREGGSMVTDKKINRVSLSRPLLGWLTPCGCTNLHAQKMPGGGGGGGNQHRGAPAPMAGGGGGGGGPRGSGNQNARVYVGNLAWDVAWQDLKDHMRGLGGDVVRADVMTDQGGRSRGCGIVEFADPGQASQAIEQLNNSELKGRMIFVREVNSVGCGCGWGCGCGCETGWAAPGGVAG